MMNIGVTGYKGRLGSVLVGLGYTPVPVNIIELGSKDKSYLNTFDIIVNCAAYTDVDEAENNKVLCAKVNDFGTHSLRKFYDGKIIHLSTDFVFDGKHGPYIEMVGRSPISTYGSSKAWAEWELSPSDTIIRTTLLYSKRKNDFVGRVLDKIKFGNNFFVVDDMFGNPTYVPHLANAIKWMIDNNVMPPVINIAGKEVISRYEFAKMIAHTFGYDDTIVLAKPYEWIEGTAKRPLKAGLVVDLAESLGIPIYSVQQGLDELKKEIK